MLRLAALLAALPALADEPPPNLCLPGTASGDACSTGDGAPGRCARHLVTYEHAGQPRTAEELRCVALLGAEARSRLPWFGAGLGFGALVVGVALRRPATRRWALHARPPVA